MFSPLPPIWNIIQKVWADIQPKKAKRISANWTIEMEDDIECLYDVNIKSELVSVISKEIGNEILKELLSTQG